MSEVRTDGWRSGLKERKWLPFFGNVLHHEHGNFWYTQSWQKGNVWKMPKDERQVYIDAGKRRFLRFVRPLPAPHTVSKKLMKRWTNG